MYGPTVSGDHGKGVPYDSLVGECGNGKEDEWRRKGVACPWSTGQALAEVSLPPLRPCPRRTSSSPTPPVDVTRYHPRHYGPLTGRLRHM